MLFDSGSAQLKPYTLSILKEIAQELGKLPNHILIGGHTDSMHYPGKSYTNWELSADRANSARRVLEASGVKPGQVQRVTGYADSVPLANHEPTDPQNRRISIVVLNSASEKADVERQKPKAAKPAASKPCHRPASITWSSPPPRWPKGRLMCRPSWASPSSPAAGPRAWAPTTAC